MALATASLERHSNRARPTTSILDIVESDERAPRTIPFFVPSYRVRVFNLAFFFFFEKRHCVRIAMAYRGSEKGSDVQIRWCSGGIRAMHAVHARGARYASLLATVARVARPELDSELSSVETWCGAMRRSGIAREGEEGGKESEREKEGGRGRRKDSNFD